MRYCVETPKVRCDKKTKY